MWGEIETIAPTRTFQANFFKHVNAKSCKSSSTRRISQDAEQIEVPLWLSARGTSFSFHPMSRQIVLAFVVALAISSCLGQNQCLKNRLSDVKSRKTPMRGANLGSWFIQEGWMVGWLWNDNNCDVGTYAGTTKLEQCLGNKVASVMEKHWSTFVTEADFQKLAQYNLNTVRLPVGWWQIYDPQGGAAKAKLNQYVVPTNYATGALKYIDKAFEWGAKYGVGILLDLHAAPGSQNGDDHSAPNDPGKQYWDAYSANQAQSIDSLGLYAQRYGNHSALLGFCLLNEPKVNTTTLKAYYKAAYAKIRNYAAKALIVINPLITNQNTADQEWTSFMNPPNYQNVLMSHHWYHIWGFEGKSDQDKLNYIKYDRNGQVSEYMQKNPKPGVIDEWSLGGIADGYAAMQAQLDPFNKINGGWIFWAWSKTWGGDAWSLQAAFEKGWINKGQTGIASC
ncbi:putative glucan 1,3-beta-glucosidase [Planoprotostelium fungivorum]|uniref:glucan 1,3-beta-glucosidase n=1 Tax=Planoprotostelium fungivorum TaxID=1890364 RepID=A0A2P6NYZ0_9EUKA|nr:putative glucan 1,3-beta-glucosidase [Planoprotostelium fungivorum]